MNTKNPLTITRGLAKPFGATVMGERINFSLFSMSASPPTLCLFKRGESSPHYEVAFDPVQHRTGHVWHLAIEGLPSSLVYGYRFENNVILIDPYAKAVISKQKWNDSDQEYCPLGAILEKSSFDWQGDLPLQLPLQKMIIYEMHLRGFTADPSSNVKNPGSFQAAIEKIPYLRDLGINAIELLPIYEFNECEYRQNNPSKKTPLCNFWGYSTVNFFSLMQRYVSAESPEEGINEFKTFVRELHKNGIEIILDVVYNHSAEGNEKGPIYHFKELANGTYYILDPDGGYSNYTGCGNTMNCNHPVVIEMMISSLRYWVTEMHVDGFRFDLASILCRDQDGKILGDAPLIKAITEDPILANTKLIAEPWDAAGAYQVGSFGPPSSRWCEWNGRYRDDIRKFIKGTGSKGDFATRFSGSQDLYLSRGNGCRTSVNFITAHDGFTLKDLVSYNHKHNVDNGENNRDGSSFNDSWNCGEEGATNNQKILILRQQQMRNLLLALMLSQGIPMLLMGDEYGHSKNGNNNTWCQDNSLNWFLWNETAQNNFLRFYRTLIAFRKSHPFFDRTTFLTDKDIVWHSCKLDDPCWNNQSQFIAMTLKDPNGTHDLFLAFNTSHKEVLAELPTQQSMGWHWVVNTANPSPNDIYETKGAEILPEEVNTATKGAVVNVKVYSLKPYSAILLQAT